MRTLGEACLLAAFVGSGFAAFACLAGANRPDRRVRLAGTWAAGASVLGLTVVAAVLAGALYHRDFSFAYVAQYSSKLLPWHYSLSALWVGQAGVVGRPGRLAVAVGLVDGRAGVAVPLVAAVAFA